MNEDEYEEDGIMHELLAPGDFRERGVGVLMDDELYSSFVTKVPEGVHAVVVIDTCHPASFRSGKSSAIDLPYAYAAGDEDIRYSEGFRPGRMLMASAAGAAALNSKSKKKKKEKKKKYKGDEGEELKDPSGYDDGSYEEEQPKQKKKSKSKKKKGDDDYEDETYHDSYEASEISEEAKSKKKSKSKKKKKQENGENLGDGPEEDKPKKKKKKPKKK